MKNSKIEQSKAEYVCQKWYSLYEAELKRQYRDVGAMFQQLWNIVRGVVRSICASFVVAATSLIVFIVGSMYQALPFAVPPNTEYHLIAQELFPMFVFVSFFSAMLVNYGRFTNVFQRNALEFADRETEKIRRILEIEKVLSSHGILEEDFKSLV